MSGDAANAGVRGAMGVGGMREGRVGGEERRRLVVERLRAAKSSVRGSDLAAEQGVSRQVIVQDIALLRSAGAPAPAHEAARLVALSNGLAQSVLIGALSPDRATDILGSEVASLRAAVNSTDADAGRPAPSTPSARKSSAQE